MAARALWRAIPSPGTPVDPDATLELFGVAVQAALIQKVVIGTMVSLLVFGVGTDLQLSAIRSVFRRPKALLMGLGLNHLIMPALALGLCMALGVGTSFTLGVVICTAAPGGPLGPVLAQSAKVDLAYAACLVVVMNLINTLGTPLTLAAVGEVLLSDEARVGIELGQAPAMMQTILLFQILPLGLGVAWHHHRPEAAQRWGGRASKVGKVLIVLVVLAAVVDQVRKAGQTDWGGALLGLGAVEITVVAGLVLSFAMPVGSLATRGALAFSTAIRSLSLAMLIIAAWFPQPEVILGAAVYSTCMFWTSVPLVPWVRKRLGLPGQVAGPAGSVSGP